MGGEEASRTEWLRGLALTKELCKPNRADEVVGGVLATFDIPKLGLPGRLLKPSLGVFALDRIKGLYVDAGASPFARSLSFEVDGTGRARVDTGADSSRTVRCSVFRDSSSSRLSLRRVIADTCESSPIDSFEVMFPT